MNKYGYLLFAALCGALVSLKVEQKAQTIVQKFTFVLCGIAFAFFITPLITEHFHLIEPGEISAIGFIMAMMWLNIYNRFSRGIEEASLPFDPKPEAVEVAEKVIEAEEVSREVER